MDWGQRFPEVLIWTGISEDLGHRSSEAIGCTCDVFPRLAAIRQLRDYIRGLLLPCSVLCVFRESTPSVCFLRFLFGWKVQCAWDFFFWPVFIHFVPPLFSISHFIFWFLGPVFFCLSITLVESVLWLWVLFPLPPFRHQGTSLPWPFLWFGLTNYCPGRLSDPFTLFW